MLLHEFMRDHRSEILDSCLRRLHENIVSSPDIDVEIEEFFEETYRALRRESGHRDSVSPLPAGSDAATRLGQQPQPVFVDPGKVPLIFGAISNAIGDVGALYELEIAAEEYKVFNQCIDSGVAACIEQCWGRELKERRQQMSASFGYLAHELRVALGNASLAFTLLRTGEVGMNGRTAAVLANNLARMETLVARSLGEAQLEAGVPPTLQPLRVASVLRKLQASFIPERAIALVLQLEEGLYIAGDELLLTSAISNLLSNAIKFSHSGSKIVLRAYGGTDAVVIEVEDECGGLKVPDTSKLLLPFVKGNEHPANVGLGLSITKRAVEAMKGVVSIADQPGKGCIFSLHFPHVRPSLGQ